MPEDRRKKALILKCNTIKEACNILLQITDDDIALCNSDLEGVKPENWYLERIQEWSNIGAMLNMAMKMMDHPLEK